MPASGHNRSQRTIHRRLLEFITATCGEAELRARPLGFKCHWPTISASARVINTISREAVIRTRTFTAILSRLLFNRASVACEELASRLSEQTNPRRYMLSTVAGLFLPLGFLTGLLDTSVGGIPWRKTPWFFLKLMSFFNLLIAIWTIAFQRNKWC